MWNCELPDVQAGFRKGRGTRNQIANIGWIIDTAREFQKKHLLLLYWLSQSLWLCGSQQTGKFLKRWEYQTTLPSFWETCMQVKKQQLEQRWNNRLVPNWERSTSRLYIVTLLINFIQCTSCKMLDWMKHKLESRLPGEISITSDM